MQISSAPASATVLDWGTAWLRGLIRFQRNKPLGAIMGVIIVVIVLVAVLADGIAPYDPLDTDPFMARRPPDSVHWMGYDEVGRDILSRVIFGSRVSLIVGITSVIFGTTIGSIWGLASGYLGALKFDLITQRAVHGVLGQYAWERGRTGDQPALVADHLPRPSHRHHGAELQHLRRRHPRRPRPPPPRLRSAVGIGSLKLNGSASKRSI